MDLNLRGKWAVVTGGSKGIGFAIADSFAAEGCNIHIAAREDDELVEAKQAIVGKHGVEVVTHALDLSVGANIKTLAAACHDVDILINSAGGIPRGTILEIDEETWRRAWELKVFGYINLTREIYRGMEARRSGVIVNIIGMSGDRPDAYYIAGSTANAALMNFTRALGGDSVRYGVRVVGVNPGPVETPKHVADTERLAQQSLGDKNKWRDVMAGLPMGRAALPDEVSAAVVFLASDRASYISGSIVTIDGGLLVDSAIGVRRG